MKRIIGLLAIYFAIASPAAAQFSEQATWAGTSGGSANAQTITVANATALADLLGVPLRFIAGNTNTGATTFAVTGLTATAGRKPSSTGLAAFSGSELVAGQTAEIVYDGTFFVLISNTGAFPPVSTSQVLTSGSGATYTTPTGVRQLRIRMIGGGGGGVGGGGNGVAGTASSFNSITAAQGGAGGGAGGGIGGSGGSGSASLRIPGGDGGTGMSNTSAQVGPSGGIGGSGFFGGSGRSGIVGTGTGTPGKTNSGAGGGGFSAGIGGGSGGGGGAGEYVELIINSPAGTYLYTVGSGGAGGGGTVGGAGAAGIIIVDELY